ncbi:hypothetical protein Tco_0154932 [Tanacetum coccineum]
MRIMECIRQASGLKINTNKTKVYGIGVQMDEVEQFASRMGCSAGNMPFTYLGMPVNDGGDFKWKDTDYGLKSSKVFTVVMEVGGGGVLLYEKFLRIFRLETNKDESVGEKRVWGEEGWEWQWNWARDLRGRGEGNLMELTTLTYFFVPNVLQLAKFSMPLFQLLLLVAGRSKFLVGSFGHAFHGNEVDG